MRITLEVWRQAGPQALGRFETHEVTDATPEMSLPELLDRLNAQIVASGGEPIAFESDCREGICGACGVTVDGTPHGPVPNTPTCRQHLRHFRDGDRIRVEPLRSAAFPVVRDLVVDRTALDEVVRAGGFCSVDTATAPDAESRQIGTDRAEHALDFAACIGCGACVAACPNGAAHLFGGALLSHLATLPQGRPERSARARGVLAELDTHFGACSTYAECVTVCPAGITLDAVAWVNREGMRAALRRGRAD